MNLIGWLTALVSDTTMALVEHSVLLGPRHSDMRNPRYEGRELHLLKKFRVLLAERSALGVSFK